MDTIVNIVLNGEVKRFSLPYTGPKYVVSDDSIGSIRIPKLVCMADCELILPYGVASLKYATCPLMITESEWCDYVNDYNLVMYTDIGYDLLSIIVWAWSGGQDEVNWSVTPGPSGCAIISYGKEDIIIPKRMIDYLNDLVNDLLDEGCVYNTSPVVGMMIATEEGELPVLDFVSDDFVMPVPIIGDVFCHDETVSSSMLVGYSDKLCPTVKKTYIPCEICVDSFIAYDKNDNPTRFPIICTYDVIQLMNSQFLAAFESIIHGRTVASITVYANCSIYSLAGEHCMYWKVFGISDGLSAMVKFMYFMLYYDWTCGFKSGNMVVYSVCSEGDSRYGDYLLREILSLHCRPYHDTINFVKLSLSRGAHCGGHMISPTYVRTSHGCFISIMRSKDVLCEKILFKTRKKSDTLSYKVIGAHLYQPHYEYIDPAVVEKRVYITNIDGIRYAVAISDEGVDNVQYATSMVAFYAFSFLTFGVLFNNDILTGTKRTLFPSNTLSQIFIDTKNMQVSGFGEFVSYDQATIALTF